MNLTKRKHAKSAPQDAASDEASDLGQVIRDLLTRSETLISSTRTSERDAVVRALEEVRNHWATLEATEHARDLAVRELGEELHGRVLEVASQTADTVLALRSALSEASEAASRSGLELASVRQELSATRDNADELTRTVAVVQSELGARADQQHALETDMLAAKAEIARLESQLQDALGAATDAGLHLIEARRSVDALTAECDRLQVDGDRARTELDQERAASGERESILQQRVDKLSSSVQELTVRAMDRDTELQQLRAELEAARAEIHREANAISEQHDGFIVNLTEEYEEKLAEAERRAIDAAQRAADGAARLEEITLQVDVLSSQRVEYLQLAREADVERQELQQSIKRVEGGRDQARERLGQAERDRDAAREQLETAQRDRDTVREQLETAERDRDAAREQLETAQRDRDAAREQLETAQRDRETVREQLETAQRDRDAVREQLETEQRDRDTVREQLETAQRDRDATREQLETAQREGTERERLLAAERQRVDELQRELADRELVDSTRRPGAVSEEAKKAIEKLHSELAVVRRELNLALSEREAAVTDALRIQRQLDEAMAVMADGRTPNEALSPRASVMPAPIDPQGHSDELHRTVDRLERERDEAMHTLAELRMDLTQAHAENKKLKGMIGFIDDVQLVLPVEDLEPTPANADASVRATSKPRRSKPPADRSASSYFVSGEGIAEETLTTPSRRSRTSEPAPGGSGRRRTRSK